MGDSPTLRPAPIRKRDNTFFWDGTRVEELRIQQCQRCDHLQHPPGPMCSCCQGTDMGHAVVSGKGTVYSWIVPRYPEIPLFEPGLIVALIDLEEGVRLLSNLCEVSLEDVHSGMQVELFFAQTQGEDKVPQFRPARR